MNVESSSGDNRPFCVVVGLAFTDAGSYAFEQSVRIARRIPGCALHLLHVVPGKTGEAEARALLGHLRLYVNANARSLGSLAGVTIGIHVREGDPVKELASFARDVGADLVVIGSNAGHLRSWHTPPKVERLVALASSPVLVAGPKPRPHDEKIPVIEPPCSDCVYTRAASSGATWWCTRHAAPASRAHTYSYQRELPLRSHDTEVIPAAIEIG